MNHNVFIASALSSALTGYGVYSTMANYHGNTLVVDIVGALAYAVVLAWML